MIWNNYDQILNRTGMKINYRIDAKEMGVFLLKRRKVAKAFRWWLRENGFNYESSYFPGKSENKSSH